MVIIKIQTDNVKLATIHVLIVQIMVQIIAHNAQVQYI
jgi:hypothetical protein